jgi:hypothetical protein
MSDPELFIAFGAICLVIALAAVAVDWVGKPLRHRKFVPKVYRYPDERRPRGSSVRPTEWSDRAFVLPVAAPPPRPGIGAAADAPAALPGAVHPGLSVFDQDFDDVDDDGPPTEALEPARSRGWRPGDSVHHLDDNGEPPTAALVRERFWRNVAATAGAAMFGADNVDRMAAGRGPRRRNPRTGQIETMRLPDVDSTGTSLPVPSWPDDAVDPFAEPSDRAH